MKLTKMFLALAAVLLLCTLAASAQCDPAQADNKAKFRTLTNAQKAQVWRYQLTLRLDTEAFTPEQRAAVVKAIGTLTAEFFTKQDPAAVKALDAELLKVFTKEEYARYFTKIGQGATQNYLAKIRLDPKRRPDCSCNDAAYPLCDFCRQGIGTCTASEYGCGPFWVLRCNGLCNGEGDAEVIDGGPEN
jgi:hypothetical protein